MQRPKCPVLEPVPLVVLLITSLGPRKANTFLEGSQFNLNSCVLPGGDFVPRWDRQQRGIRFASSDVLKTRASLDLFVKSESIQAESRQARLTCTLPRLSWASPCQCRSGCTRNARRIARVRHFFKFRWYMISQRRMQSYPVVVGIDERRNVNSRSRYPSHQGPSVSMSERSWRS